MILQKRASTSFTEWRVFNIYVHNSRNLFHLLPGIVRDTKQQIYMYAICTPMRYLYAGTSRCGNSDPSGGRARPQHEQPRVWSSRENEWHALYLKSRYKVASSRLSLSRRDYSVRNSMSTSPPNPILIAPGNDKRAQWGSRRWITDNHYNRYVVIKPNDVLLMICQ